MANLKINLPNGNVKEASEINLEEYTPNQIIQSFIEQNQLDRPPTGEEYRKAKGSIPLEKGEHNKTLSELGVKDGEELSILSKPTGA